jgi:hypothetical protein
MAVVIITTDFPEGVGPDRYDKVNAEMGEEGNPPQGLIFHWAAEVDGKWTITDVWESRADHDRFQEERLGPAIHKVAADEGLEVGSPPTTTEAPVHNYIKP